MKEKDIYVAALCEELTERKVYLDEPVQTIYLGGGTPSQLTAADFHTLFDTINANYTVLPEAEITLEANPDDLTDDYLRSLRSLPFNRVSLGVQSFDDDELRFLGRRHDARSAEDAVARLQAAGIENISIDLMYGLPGQTLAGWTNTIRRALALNVNHISAYHLIYEEGTRLYRMLEAGAVSPVDEDLSLQMFERLIDQLGEAGFEHYEISNFARTGYRSRHNSSYWNGSPYLGVGAAAHSYNRTSRQWNASDLASYRHVAPELEIIDSRTAYNDFIITRLRTSEGILLDELSRLFGKEKYDFCLAQAERHLNQGLLETDGNSLRLSRKGIFVSDGLMSDLMESQI